jgi:hypothetical protein
MGTNNLFKLFDHQPNWREAETQLKAACQEAAEKIIAIQKQYADCGAGYSESRSEITGYIWDLLLRIPVDRYLADMKANWKTLTPAERACYTVMIKSKTGGQFED